MTNIFKSYCFCCCKICTRIFLLVVMVYLASYVVSMGILNKSQEYFPPQNANVDNAETVVVLHGIGKNNRITYLLSKRISEAGFEVYNISYPYAEYTIQELADFLNGKFVDLGIDRKRQINIVGHSMGGLVARAYIKKYNPQNLHRVVMIATPNYGSELANIMHNNIIYKIKFGSKSGKQIGTNLSGLDDAFGKVNYDLGIIAGKTWIDPLSSSFLPGVDDGVVAVDSTKLEGMNDHVVMNFSHTMGVQYREVADMVIFYLKNGRFKIKNNP